MSSLNYMELCRLCLVKDRVQIPIFEGEGDIRQIFLKIAACLPVKVKKDDKLPKKICDDCMYKVEMLYQFWNTTANAEKQLLEWLGEAVEEKKTSNETHVKQESMEQDPGSELAKSLSRVEAVLAEAREAESDTDNFGVGKAETDSDDEPLSSLEPTTFVGVDSSGTNVSQTQGEFLAPSAPSTSKTSSALQSSGIAGEHDIGLLFRETASLFTSLVNHTTKKRRRNSKTKKEALKDHSFCYECKKLYKSKEHYTRHVREFHPVDHPTPMKTRVTCHVCNKTLKDKYVLKVHMKTHGTKFDHKCPFCEYSNNSLFYMKIHINKHNKNPSFICELCGDKFYQKHILQAHVRVKHGDGYRCMICEKTYHDKRYLKLHERLHDPNYEEPPGHKCNECGQIFKVRTRLKYHMNRHRGITQSFSCNICEKTVSSKSSFNNHMKIHTGEKNCMCDICGKAFSMKKYLEIHKRSHTGEKPYVCAECGKSFTQQSSLVIHRRYHSGERPFPCEFCEKAFVTRTLLTAHRKSHEAI